MSNNVAPLNAPYLLNSVDTDVPNGVVFPGVAIQGVIPPADNRYFWLKTSDTPNTLWAYSPAVVDWINIGASTTTTNYPWTTLLTESFVVGSQGDTVTADVVSNSWFVIGSIVIITDSSLVYATYQVIALSADIAHPVGVVLERIDSNLSSTYIFTTANTSKIVLGGGGGGSSLEITDGTNTIPSANEIVVGDGLSLGISGNTATLTSNITNTLQSMSVSSGIVPVSGYSTVDIFGNALVLNTNNWGVLSSVTSTVDCMIRICQTSAELSNVISKNLEPPLPSDGVISGDIYCASGVTVPISLGSWCGGVLYVAIYNLSSVATPIALTFAGS